MSVTSKQVVHVSLHAALVRLNGYVFVVVGSSRVDLQSTFLKAHQQGWRKKKCKLVVRLPEQNDTSGSGENKENVCQSKVSKTERAPFV